MAVDGIERTRVRNKIIDLELMPIKKKRNLIIGDFKPCTDDVFYCVRFVSIVLRSNELGINKQFPSVFKTWKHSNCPNNRHC